MARYTVADLNNLAELSAATMTPEQMEAFAVAAASIGDTYTLRNRFLMWVQNPNVTRVAGFHAWKDRGRKVRKGARGLAILAPVTRKKKDTDNNADDADSGRTDEDAPRKVVAVRVTYVFDRSQTEPIEACTDHDATPGQECPNCADAGESAPAGPRPTADELAELLADLTEAAEDDAA